ncbi:ribokinase [Wenxinia saemankumensis]|uniref:Ribokinase n=1 Tax=Wenxinia saemankumensis TaxID=1447782 RepID=A0A1M6G126_9RHOB|nr:ribokinase [Wenxinia saemankumensis]SHJ03675.1 ribokinase [Wenxinia saemankumensis]
MAVVNLGSINADMVYSVPHIPAPGETLAATGFRSYLGGKGANMSVAIARAGGRVRHVGAVGADGDWAVRRLEKAGVECLHVAQADEATGTALIFVDPQGENAIVIHPGANAAVPAQALQDAIEGAAPGDWFLTQNETNLQDEGMRIARDQGLRLAYAAAPFDAARVTALLPLGLSLLVLNAVEADQLRRATGQDLADLPVTDVIVTLGAKGCDWIRGGQVRRFDAIPVTPVDTTGAGDTFSGYLVAGLDSGLGMEAAIRRAQAAGALMVTRHGTSDVIPTSEETDDFARNRA